MDAKPNLEDLRAAARAFVVREGASQVPGFATLRVEAGAKAHALLPGRRAAFEVAAAEPDPAAGTPRYDLVLHPGAFPPGTPPGAEFEGALHFGLEQIAERAAADDAMADDASLFEAHARFLRGLETLAGWYRRGEPLAESVWAVDLDLFADLVVSRETWGALRGRRTALEILGEAIELEIPADAGPDEAFTLEDAGLFEPAAGIEEDELADDDGRYGDLHVVPLVY